MEKKKKRSRLKKALIILIISYVVMVGMVTALQEKIIFLPDLLDQDHTYSFEAPHQEFFIETDDGARLNALKFSVDNAKGVVLYFHGNAGNLDRWGNIVQDVVRRGYDVLVMDYRGYGKSTGKLSEANLFNDSQLFYDHLLKDYKEADIIIYGRSLGAALATQLASKNRPRQLILETPFYNLSEVAKRRFPFLPAKTLLNYRFESNKYIQKVKCPITILHGTNDKVVDFESGKKLFDAIPGNDKRFFVIPNGGHNDLIEFEAFHAAMAKTL